MPARRPSPALLLLALVVLCAAPRRGGGHRADRAGGRGRRGRDGRHRPPGRHRRPGDAAGSDRPASGGADRRRPPGWPPDAAAHRHGGRPPTSSTTTTTAGPPVTDGHRRRRRHPPRCRPRPWSWWSRRPTRSWRWSTPPGPRRPRPAPRSRSTPAHRRRPGPQRRHGRPRLLSHTTPEGVTFDQRIKNAGYPLPGPRTSPGASERPRASCPPGWGRRAIAGTSRTAGSPPSAWASTQPRTWTQDFGY